MPKEERSTGTTNDSVSINESTSIDNESASVEKENTPSKSNLDDYTPPRQDTNSE